MKRLFAVLFFAGLAISAFALESAFLGQSAGIGLGWAPYYQNYTATKASETSSSTFRTTHISCSAYFDAVYAQLSLGLGVSSRNAAMKAVDDFGILGGNADGSYFDYPAVTFLAFGLLCKYPFDMTGFTLFPLLGFEYDLNLSYKDADGNDLKMNMTGDEKSNLNYFWIKAGCGLDIPISKRLSLRPEVLIAYKLRSQFEKDWVDAQKASGMDSYSVTTVKVDIGLSLGYQL